MMRVRWLMVAVSGGVLISVATPRAAKACSPALCVPAKFTPAGTVPANFAGVVWRQLVDHSHPDHAYGPAQVSLARAAEPGTPLPFTATPNGVNTYLLVPDKPFTVGESYVATDATVCEAYGPADPPGARTGFVIGPPAAMPTTLGTLAASNLVVGQFFAPGAFDPCDVEVTAASQTVQLTLAPDAVPWTSLLQLEVSVDDQGWTPSRYEDHSADTVVTIYHACPGADPGADTGVAGGSHVVRMRGTIAGTTMSVVSATATINLDCDGASGGGSSTGGPDRGDPNRGDPGSAGGGGCSTGGPGSSAWLGLALGALLLRRARR